MANLSNKAGRKTDRPIDPFKDLEGRDWIEKLQTQALRKYGNPNDVIQDRRAEEGATKDYAGRWLWELLQNIDDAIGPEDYQKFIGTKGLGFLAILQIGHSPEIHSGPFHFMFSKEQTTKKLLEADKVPEDTARNPPQFEVPHPCDADEHVKELLADNFSTVIKVSIYDEAASKVHKRLEDIRPDFLLFSQHIESLEIDLGDGTSRKYEKTEEIHEEDQGGLTKSEISISYSSGQSQEKSARTKRWIRWKRQWKSEQQSNKQSSCAFCLPLIDGKCRPHTSKPRVFNFYPTDEDCDIFGFLHITFELSQSRKYMQMWGDEKDWDDPKCDPENSRLLTELESLIIHDVMQDDLVSSTTCLEVFQDLEPDYGDELENRPVLKLKELIAVAVRSNGLVPVFGDHDDPNTQWVCEPGKAVLWKHNFLDCLKPTGSIYTNNLVKPELNLIGDVLIKNTEQPSLIGMIPFLSYGITISRIPRIRRDGIS